MINYYISTGEKTGFYTLWAENGKASYDALGSYSGDTEKFVCNLSTTREGAKRSIAKRFNGEVEGKDYVIHWDFDGELSEWGTKFSKRELEHIGHIENGCMPWGKHLGVSFEAISVYSLLWHMNVDRRNSYGINAKPNMNKISVMLYDALVKHSETNGKRAFAGHYKMIKDKEIAKEAREAEKLKSEFVGVVGEKQEFSLVIDYIHYFDTHWGQSSITLLSDSDGNQVVYKGQSYIGDTGKEVSLTAKVKEHCIRAGVKQTIIQRPKVIKGEIK